MQKHSLSATQRTIVGRKVKTLRKQGVLPATLYGKAISSHTIQIDAATFAKVFTAAGETGIVEITVGGKTFPTIIHNVQRHPVTNAPLHVDFFNVNLKEKIVANVPLSIIGESPAVKDKLGVLLTMLTEIEVEALPTELPEHIDVDISNLTAVDQTVKVQNLTVPSGVKIVTDAEQEVAKIAPLISKEAEQQIAQDAQTQAALEPTEGIGESEKEEKEAAPSKAADNAAAKPSEEKK